MADELPEDISTEDERTASRRFLDWTWDVVRTWGPALFIVLFIRSVIAEPFRIPSGSMVPTLQIGDHILVTKYSYGWRIPLTRIYLTEPELPERGDVVVFVKPGTDGGQYFDQNLTLSPHKDPNTGIIIPQNGKLSKGLSYYLDLPFPPFATLDFVKRVIALPGDTVEVVQQDHFTYVKVNGQIQTQSLVTDGGPEGRIYTDDRCSDWSVHTLVETLDGKPHQILRDASYRSDGTSVSVEFPETPVPEGHVFVMGDNRDHSFDSRGWGFVPIRNIKGKAQKVWLSYDKCKDGLPLVGSLRGDRWWTTIE